MSLFDPSRYFFKIQRLERRCITDYEYPDAQPGDVGSTGSGRDDFGDELASVVLFGADGEVVFHDGKRRIGFK